MRSFVPDYDMVSAATLAEALRALGANEGWRPIAGGTDLMVLFNAGNLAYRKLVGIRNIAELRTISESESHVSLGAAVTYRQIGDNQLMRREFPLLGQAAAWTGAIANQNRGTVGGNIVNASPAADSCPALLVYDAELELSSVRGTRRIPYRDFHLGYKQTQIREDELLCTIHLPLRSAQWQQHSRKVGPRKAQAISKVCFAAAAQVTNGVIEDIRIALGSVAPVPLRCVQTESLLRSRSLSSTLISEAAAAVAAEVQPITDIRSTALYRRTVSANLLAEFIGSLR